MTPARSALPKITAPRADGVVSRRRVHQALERALRQGIAWVAAPAGYGKSTALADYAARRDAACLWYRVDRGDRDVASFFHHLALSVGSRQRAPRLPVFGPEYADQTEAFARRFFRALFARLSARTLLVLDDLHHVEQPRWDSLLEALLHELPESCRCACLSRRLPTEGLRRALAGRLVVLDQSTLAFSEREARRLLARRLPRRTRGLDIAPARGWAAGLVLLADQAAAGTPIEAPAERPALLGAVARQLFDALTPREQDALCKLSLLRDITPDLAAAMTGSDFAGRLLERLHRRQLLVLRGATGRVVFQLHDLLRDFLRHHLASPARARGRARLYRRAAGVLHRAGRTDEAVELALLARDWHLARRLVVARAPALLALGQRATLIAWSHALPERAREDAWLCYWLGVAHVADDAAAETWLARAWALFARRSDVQGQRLVAAQVVLSKTDSWRTHTGLAVWTRRLLAHLGRPWRGHSELLVFSGMLRAVDFAEDYRSDGPDVRRLRAHLLARLATPAAGDSPTLRLIASETLIEHAGTTGAATLFEQAVDSVLPDLRARAASPWALGLWLIAFGTVSGRYFPFARRGCPYRSPEQALRAALEIGVNEGLRGVEFGALYHLQLLAKLRGDMAEFAELVTRLVAIADSRYTTQVAVAADCQAALHTLHGRHAEALRACERFMAAITAAAEPPVERWPHFITKFQALLGAGQARAAARFLAGLLPLFDGELRRRTAACITLAQACAAKWRLSPEYPAHLRASMEALQTLSYPAVLANLPDLLAELCADALDHGIALDFCRALIVRRGLRPPAARPHTWPWALRVGVLGAATLERDGVPLHSGAKAPMRALNIVYFLALAPGRCCALEEVCAQLWPDLDGDQARAAAEQALHRLRRRLGRADLVTQREGVLRLCDQLVWVDLHAWELALRAARARNASPAARDLACERAFWSFGGAVLQSLPSAPWSLAAAERVRADYVDLALVLAGRLAARGETLAARHVYLRVLELYPDCEPCYEALVRASLAHGGVAVAVEDFRRYERVARATGGLEPSRALGALVQRALAAGVAPRRAP